MTTRAEQRANTRARIVDAAIESFAANGFDGASTRDIAALADVTQGLVTYHFESKQGLWRAAASQLFADLSAALPGHIGDTAIDNGGARATIRSYVAFAAERPQLFHFMVDAGRTEDERMHWLVENHLRPRFNDIAQLAPSDELAPHLHYALLGASSLFFALGPENRALTGIDPTTREAIERHADFIAEMFAPDTST